MSTLYRLEVLIEDPTHMAFRLDTDALDGRIPLRVAGQGLFTLSGSLLDDARLGPLPTRKVWFDLAPWCQSIHTRHGHRSGTVIEPDPGSLSAELLDCPDLAQLGIHTGTPVRVIADTNRLPDTAPVVLPSPRATSTPLGSIDIPHLPGETLTATLEVRSTTVTRLQLSSRYKGVGAAEKFHPDTAVPATGEWEQLTVPLTMPATRGSRLHIRPLTGTGTLEVRTLRVSAPTTLWEGKIEDVADQWTKRGNWKRTTLTGTDVIADIAAITRYGAQVTQPIKARLETLAASAPVPLTVATPPLHTTVCIPTLHESSLVKHLTMAATTARATWHIRDGVLRLQDPAQPGTPLAVFSDLEAPSYLELSRVSGSGRVVTAVDLTTHGIGADGNTDDKTRTVTDPTAASAFGNRAGSASVTARLEDLDQIGRWLLAPLTSTDQTVTQIRVRGHDATHDFQPLAPLDAIDVIRLGRRHLVRVLSISHTIEITTHLPAPEITHTTTLHLVRRNPT